MGNIPWVRYQTLPGNCLYTLLYLYHIKNSIYYLDQNLLFWFYHFSSVSCLLLTIYCKWYVNKFKHLEQIHDKNSVNQCTVFFGVDIQALFNSLRLKQIIKNAISAVLIVKQNTNIYYGVQGNLIKSCFFSFAHITSQHGEFNIGLMVSSAWPKILTFSLQCCLLVFQYCIILS